MRAVGIATAVALLLALLFLVSTRSGTSRTATAVVPSSRLKAVDGAGQTSTGAAPRVYSYQVVASFPHDASCFTQGLLYAGNDTFYESCGQYGQSDVRHVRLQDGAVLRRTRVEPKYFAEGLAQMGDTLLQLTWQTNTVLRYKAATLELLGTANTQLSDGWGLTTRGGRNRLLATDGSAQVSTLDARTLRTVSAVTVRDAGRDVRLLNELEFIDGEVWANIWLTDCIARIDPETGRLNGWLLMHGLRGSDVRSPGEDVLNGIAWDGAANGGRLFVTGKLWPKLYEIRVVEKTGELDTARQACIR